MPQKPDLGGAPCAADSGWLDGSYWDDATLCGASSQGMR